MRTKFLCSMLLLMTSIIDLQAKDTFIRENSQIVLERGNVFFDPREGGQGNVVLSPCGNYLIVEREGNYKITGEVRIQEIFSSFDRGVKGDFGLEGRGTVHKLFKPFRPNSTQPTLKKFKINKLFLGSGAYQVLNFFKGPFQLARILIVGDSPENKAFKITFERLPDE